MFSPFDDKKMKADRFDKFTLATEIVDVMGRMTLTEIAAALDRTRAAFTRQPKAYDRETWETVFWKEVIKVYPPHMRPPRTGVIELAKSFEPQFYKLMQKDLQIPFLHLTACLHYYAYLSNLSQFIDYELSDQQAQLLIAENRSVYVDLERNAADKYHAQVKETLDELKASDQKVLTVGFVSRPDARDIKRLDSFFTVCSSESHGGVKKSKLYYRLFGVKPTGNVPLLYLPMEYLLEKWTSINLDGRAFKLFLTMPEFTWNSVMFDQTLARVRISGEHNSLSLGLGNMSRLEVLSVQNGKLLSRNRASYILGPAFADPMRNLSKLVLVNLPSAVFPENIGLLSMPRLQTFHIENVSRGRSVYVFVAQVLGASQRTLKELVLAGPDLLVPTDLSKLVIGNTVRSLTLKAISVEITSFPSVSDGLKELSDLTLSDLPQSLSDAQYRRLLALSPLELTLESLPVSNASFSEMLRSADPDRLVTLNMSNLNDVFDLDPALSGKRALKTLRITMGTRKQGQERLNVPVRKMDSLTTFVIGGVEASKLQAMLTTSTFTEWMRQRIILEKGQDPEAKRRLSFEAFPSPQKDSDPGQQQEKRDIELDGVSFEAIEATLQDMYAPFGSKGPGQFPDRLPPASLMLSPEYAMGNLLMQTWLEWDESMVAWLSNEHGEGVQMDTLMGNAEFTKRAIVKDGDVYSLEFGCKRSTQKTALGSRLAEELEKDLGLDTANDKFWSDMDSHTAPLPLRLELVCKERVIGRSSTTNAPLIDGSVHLVYPMSDLRRFTLGPAAEKQGFRGDGSGGRGERANVLYRGQSIGHLTRYYESTPSGYKFIIGFRMRLVLGQLVRMMAAEDALLLATRPVLVAVASGTPSGTGKEKDAAAEAESLAEANVSGLPEQLRAVTEGLLFPGREMPFSREELIRHRVLANVLYTTSTIATQLPFHWDEDNSQMLAAVQQEPERQMFGNWLSVAYLFSIGLSYLLETGGLGVDERAREPDLLAHFRRLLYEPVLLPVSRWCLAYSPSTGSTVSTEESLVTVASSGDRLLALLKLIRDTLLDPQSTPNDVVSVTTMLSPPVFEEGGGGADEEDDEEGNEGVMQFVQAQADFEDAINEALDNDHHASEQFETRVGKNRRIFIDATKRLADIYIEAQTDHSGGDKYLDFGRMTAFMRRAFSEASGEFDAAARAIAAIKRDLTDEVQLDLDALSPGSGSVPVSPLARLSPSPNAASPSPKVVSPASKKSKLVARDSASPADISLSPLKRSPVRVSLSPSPPPAEKGSEERQLVPQKKRSRDTRLASVIDIVSPPRARESSSSSGGGGANSSSSTAGREDPNSLPPLPSFPSRGQRGDKEDPIILTQITHC